MSQSKPRPCLTIIHVLTRFICAGSEENTALTANDQILKGHQVILVCGPNPDDRMLARLETGVEVIEMRELVHPINPIMDLKAIAALRRLYTQRRPDVVHTHQSKAGVLGRLAARWAKVPTVLHTTHILPFLNVGPLKYLIYWTMEKIAGWYTAAFIHVSPAMEEATKAAGIGRGKIHRVIYSGIDLDRFRNAPLPNDINDFLPSRQKDAERQIVLMIAAFEPRKRQGEMVRVFEEVLAVLPNACLLLAGSGTEFAVVQNQIEESSLSNHIKCLGYRTDPERLITLSDVCILSSSREGLPRSVIQYVAGGRPVITTALPGIETLVEQGENGYLVPIDQLKDMAEPLIELLSNKTLAEKMGQASHERKLKHWDAAYMVAEIDTLIEELMPST